MNLSPSCRSPDQTADTVFCLDLGLVVVCVRRPVYSSRPLHSRSLLPGILCTSPSLLNCTMYTHCNALVQFNWNFDSASKMRYLIEADWSRTGLIYIFLWIYCEITERAIDGEQTKRSSICGEHNTKNVQNWIVAWENIDTRTRMIAGPRRIAAIAKTSV